MENLAKRYFWVVNLVVLAVLAYLTARVANNVLAGELAAVGTTPAAVGAAPPPAPRVGAKPGLASAIANRNLFNANPPVDEPVEEDEADDEELPVVSGDPPGPDDECKESDGKVSLLATMAATPAALSMAVVDDGEGPQSRVVREGQEVGDATVARIYRSRLVLNRNAGYECVELGKAKPKGRPASYSPSSSYSPPPVSSNADSKKIEEGIKKVGKDRYEIDREMLNEQLEDLGAISRQARVIPHYRDGKPQGFKIVGVRPGSLLSQLGVRSGDVLKSVGGEEIDSPNKALEMFERLKSTDNVVLEVDRRGSATTLEYQIK